MNYKKILCSEMQNVTVRFRPETIQREKPFHANTPSENGGGGVDEKLSAAACKPEEEHRAAICRQTNTGPYFLRMNLS
jgi:hypothetical protein